MVLAFLMKPGIVPTSVRRLIYIPGEDPLLFGNHGFLEEEGEARAALLPLTFRKTHTG